MERVAVIGGGNIGTLMAAEFARRGCEVRLCASDAQAWSNEIDVFGPDDDLLYNAKLEHVTNDLEEAMSGARWVVVTYPSSCFDDLSKRLVPLVTDGQLIMAVPGADAELFFSGALARGASLLGLQRVHSIARQKERGRSVYQLGKKPSVQLASIPAAVAAEVSDELSAMLGMPVELLPNYLVETLTPSNPILHTARLASMFSTWEPGVTYPSNILFYETWDEASSQLMIDCDAELQSLCRALESSTGLDLSGVRSLTEHYESPDARSMTEKIAHIPAFRGLTSPMREEAPGEWVPDFSSRYFTADFEVGLRVIYDMTKMLDIKAPHIESVLAWYGQASGKTTKQVVTIDADALFAMYQR